MNPVPLMKTLVADSLTNRNPRDASASKKKPIKLTLNQQHLLLVRSLSWLERQEMSKKQVLKTLTEILATTTNSGRASFYNASLDRSLQLAAHVWQGYPIPTG